MVEAGEAERAGRAVAWVVRVEKVEVERRVEGARRLGEQELLTETKD